MPFKSKAQFKKCWVMYNEDINNGIKPRWDCHVWAKHSKSYSKLPNYVKKSKSAYKSHRKTKHTKKSAYKSHRKTKHTKKSK
jgi:hypothetical protein